MDTRAGDFMPPLPYPKRMWAGSKMKFQSPIRIGEKVTKVITITDIAVKEGRSGKMYFVTRWRRYLVKTVG